MPAIVCSPAKLSPAPKKITLIEGYVGKLLSTKRREVVRARIAIKWMKRTTRLHIAEW
jgi:hypothetical protein